MGCWETSKKHKKTANNTENRQRYTSQVMTRHHKDLGRQTQLPRGQKQTLEGIGPWKNQWTVVGGGGVPVESKKSLGNSVIGNKNGIKQKKRKRENCKKTLRYRIQELLGCRREPKGNRNQKGIAVKKRKQEKRLLQGSNQEKVVGLFSFGQAYWRSSMASLKHPHV